MSAWAGPFEGKEEGIQIGNHVDADGEDVSPDSWLIDQLAFPNVFASC